MNRVQQLSGISEVSAAAFSAAEAQMARLQIKIQAIEAQLAQLQQELRQQGMRSGVVSVATRAGVDLRWERWVAGRQRQLISELARLRAEAENLRFGLSIAFGRKQAAETMLRDEVGARAKWRMRRQVW